MTIGHVYTLKQAAKLTGVSHSTIRRRHAEGEFPNAYKDPDGVWKIPLTDLEQAGIRPRRPERPKPDTSVSAPVTLTQPTPPVTGPTERELELIQTERELRLELEKAMGRAHEAERNVSELKGYIRGVEGQLEESRSRNSELNQHFQALTKSLSGVESRVIAMAQTPAPEPASEREEPIKRKWWQW
jgi:DNA-binding transcriptional MerR regulator